MDVDDSAAGGVERDVGGTALRAKRQRHGKAGGLVGGEQCIERHGRKDVAIVDEEW